MRSVYRNSIISHRCTTSIVVLTLVCALYPAIANAQWTRIHDLAGQITQSLVCDSRYMYIAVRDSVAMRSDDSGVTWKRIVDGLPAGSIFMDLVLVQDGVYGVIVGEGVYYISHDGDSWVEANAGFPKLPNAGEFVVADGQLYFGSILGVHRRVDDHWEQVNDSTAIGVEAVSLTVNKSEMYIGTSGSKVFHSSNGGKNWIEAGTVASGHQIVAIHATDDYVLAGHGLGGLFRSTDKGASWTRIQGNIPLHAPIWQFVEIQGTVLALTVEAIVKSTDGGLSWKKVNEGFPTIPGPQANCGCLRDGYLYVGTSRIGVWRRPLAELLPPSGVGDPGAPYALRLDQNTPNPASNHVDISYAVTSSGRVTLKVYNSLYEEVATLQEEHKEAGEYRIVFNTNALPSGIYYYRLTSDNSTMTRRMLVVK